MSAYCVLDSNLDVINIILASPDFSLPGFVLVENSNVQIGQKFTYSNGQYIPPPNLNVAVPGVVAPNIIGSLVDIQFLSNASGIYTPSSNISTIQLELLGAGGAGGGGLGTSNAGAGGGGGGYGVALISNICVSNTYTYSNGLGGMGSTMAGSAGTATSFNFDTSNYIVSGGGGGASSTTVNTMSAQGGSGGIATSGVFMYSIPAQSGGIGLHVSTTTGAGGNSKYGTGGISVYNGGSAVGANGSGYGSGGAGGSGTAKGGNGMNGLIVISEYA